MPASPRESASRSAAAPVDVLMRACESERAVPAFGALSFLESSFLPVPIDLAMVPIGISQPRRLWLVALVGAVGSLLGAAVGYLIGAVFMQALGLPLVDLYGGESGLERFRDIYGERGWMAVVIAGITPIPFKVVAILSGAAGMPPGLFLAAAFGIRLVRFALMAAVVRLFGAAFGAVMARHRHAFVGVTVALTLASVLLIPFAL